MAKLDPNYKLIREIAELKEQLTAANEKILDYEQTEAAICPEDVGIAEFVKSLNEKALRLRDALVNCQETISYVKTYVEKRGLSAEGDCSDSLERIKKVLLEK